MRQRFWLRWWLFIVLISTLFMVACERPLQEESDLTLEPDTLDGETVPGYPSAQTPAAPGLLPTPTVSTPDLEDGESETPGSGGEAEATSAPDAETEPAPTGDVIHTVVAGDTLGDLATQYGVTVEAIAEANDLPDVHTLEVGQQLLIPLSGETTGSEVPADEEPAAEEEGDDEEPAPAQEQVHIVRAGDTLFRIGQQYGFTVDELVAYNELSNPDRLEIGQEIRIPPEGFTVEP